MATLPDDELRRAVEAATGGGATADAARARMTVASIPGAGVLAERRVVRDVALAADPYPWDDAWAVADWRCAVTERVLVAASVLETSSTWDAVRVDRVVTQVEAIARRRAEAAAQTLADAEAAEEGRRAAAEQARRDATERARREHLDWTAIAVELDFRNLYRAPDAASARQSFGGDLLAAQDQVALVRAEREAAQITNERRSTQLAVSLGLAGAAFVVVGWGLPLVVEQPMGDVDDTGQRRFRTHTTFNWGAAASAGVIGWLVGRVAGPWLLSHAGDIRRGAALVPRLGVA